MEQTPTQKKRPGWLVPVAITAAVALGAGIVGGAVAASSHSTPVIVQKTADAVTTTTLATPTTLAPSTDPVSAANSAAQSAASAANSAQSAAASAQAAATTTTGAPMTTLPPSPVPDTTPQPVCPPGALNPGGTFTLDVQSFNAPPGFAWVKSTTTANKWCEVPA